jgi:hypothetical protein
MTAAERYLLKCAETGMIARFGVSSPTAKLTAGAAGAKIPDVQVSDAPDAAISSGVLRDLIIAVGADAPSDSGGVQIIGARIIGKLDLAGVSVGVPLVLVDCAFEQAPILDDADLESLSLAGSQVPGLDARGLRVHADLQLCDGFRSDGAVHLEGAAIGGNLSCNGGVIGNDSIALAVGDGLIGGHLLLSNGCELRGETSLRRTRISGMLYGAHGKLNHPGATALAAQDLVVDGDVIMGLGFRANGEVNLRRAHIGGFWYCAHGSFVNPGEIALRADGAMIADRAILGEWFNAKGAVSLAGTHIGGELNCVGGIFQNAGGDALCADRIHIGGNLRMHTRFLAEGAIRLNDATIGRTMNCSGARLENAGGVALAMRGAWVGHDVIFGSGFRALGSICMAKATIGGSFDHLDAIYESLMTEGAIVGHEP